MVAIDAGAEDIAHGRRRLRDPLRARPTSPPCATRSRRPGSRSRPPRSRSSPKSRVPLDEDSGDQADAAHRRAGGPGRCRHGPRELRRRRRGPRAGRRLSAESRSRRAAGSPEAPARSLLMAIGSVAMWLGVPLGLIYLVSKLVNYDAADARAVPDHPVRPADRDDGDRQGAGALDRWYGRRTGDARGPPPGDVAEVDARRARRNNRAAGRCSTS